MRDRIKKRDLNSSLASVSSRKRASNSSSDLNSPKRLKQSTEESLSTTNSSKFTNSYELSDFDEQNDSKTRLSRGDRSRTSFDKSKRRFETNSFNSQEENCDESNLTEITASCKKHQNELDDAERSKLIENLINQEKKRISLTTYKDEDASIDSGIFESKFFTVIEQLGKNSLDKIKEIRKLPDYEKIDKFLNTPPKTYYQKGLQSSLNAFPSPEIKTVQHWNKYSFLCRKIEQCILKREWYNLTKLLIILSDSSRSYKPFLLKSTLINLLCNSAAVEDHFMVENFLKSCYSCQSDEDIEKVLAELFHIKNKGKEVDEEKDSADEV